jgi:hypothetical protein
MSLASPILFSPSLPRVARSRAFVTLRKVLPVFLVAILASFIVSGPGWAQPDPTQSFFVPQTGSVSTPTEGNMALVSFRMCPNNDGTQVLPNNARVKVVVKASDGSPIAGISASDICVLFNGGTAEQGFAGVGADSIIANSLYNANPHCPDVRCIEADAPTDALGVTYVTLRGSTPGSPGVSTRDPNRKWGHYDSDIPVYVLGIRLSGRLTSLSPNGSYALGIKNVDIVGGLEPLVDEGEVVSTADVVAWERDFPTYTYSRDFDNNGILNSIDLNFLLAHFGHDCDTPLNP